MSEKGKHPLQHPKTTYVKCVHARTLANMSLQCEATYAYRCYMTFDPIFTHAKLLVSQSN